jgi:hypothetical protein
VLGTELGHSPVLIMALIISLIHNEEKMIDLAEVACEDITKILNKQINVLLIITLQRYKQWEQKATYAFHSV